MRARFYISFETLVHLFLRCIKLGGSHITRTNNLCLVRYPVRNSIGTSSEFVLRWKKIFSYLKVCPEPTAMLLRYEDLIMRTRESTREFNMWLYRQMHTTNSTGGGIVGRYSISRNSTLAMVRWRNEVSIEMVSVVEQYCKSVMENIGYILTHGSISLLHDLTTSSFKDV